MKYLLSQLVWSPEGMGTWMTPHPMDRMIDLRNLAAQGMPETQQGYVLIATDRDPLPGETLLAGAFNESLSAKANDAVKDLLQIPEAISPPTLPDLIRLLLGVYSDPDVGLLPPPLMPDRRGVLRFNLGEVSESYAIPASGVERDNILKVAQQQYRNARESGSHRKLLSVLQRKFRIENHEVFIPQDLPKETPEKPSTTLRDNFNVGNHSDLSGQASSDGWTWNKLEGHATALFRTNTTSDAECVNSHSGTNHCTYRADSDLSSTDHYVQGVMRTNSNNESVALIARKDSSATLTYYGMRLSALNDRLEIHKRVTGTNTALQNNAMTIAISTLYTIRFVINGSTLQTLNSGTQVGTDLTDTAVTTGLRCAIQASLAAGLGPESGGIDDFEYSDDLTPSLTDYYYRQMRAG